MSLSICRRPPATCPAPFPGSARGLSAVSPSTETCNQAPPWNRPNQALLCSASQTGRLATSPLTLPQANSNRPGPSKTHNPGT
jgi:hypothetical protein